MKKVLTWRPWSARRQLDDIQRTLQVLSPMNLKLDRILKTMSQMDDEVTKLVADVAAERTVIDSAVAAFQGFPAIVQKAIDDALAAGATQAQLQSIIDLQSASEKQASDLAAAIPANTPTP